MSSLGTSFLSMEASLPFETKTARGEDSCITILPLPLLRPQPDCPINLTLKLIRTKRLDSRILTKPLNALVVPAQRARQNGTMKHGPTLLWSGRAACHTVLTVQWASSPDLSRRDLVFASSPKIAIRHRARCASICSWANRGAPYASGWR
jgi:hypothetical protein